LNTPISRASATEDLSKYPVALVISGDGGNVTFYDLGNGTILAVVNLDGNIAWVYYPDYVPPNTTTVVIKVVVKNVTWAHHIIASGLLINPITITKGGAIKIPNYCKDLDVFFDEEDLPLVGYFELNLSMIENIIDDGDMIFLWISFDPYSSPQEELSAFMSDRIEGGECWFLGTVIGRERRVSFARLNGFYKMYHSKYQELLENYTIVVDEYEELSRAYSNLTEKYNALMKDYEKISKAYENANAKIDVLEKELIEATNETKVWRAKYNTLFNEYKKLESKYEKMQNVNRILLVTSIILFITTIIAIVRKGGRGGEK